MRCHDEDQAAAAEAVQTTAEPVDQGHGGAMARARTV